MRKNVETSVNPEVFYFGEDMPRKPKKPCNYPGCPNLTDELYCPIHKHQCNIDYSKYKRDKFDKTFYSSPEWLKVKRRQLLEEPFCRECLKKGIYTKATMVDHIKPIKQGGDWYDPSNLQSLCWSCHSKKSIEEGSRYGKKVYTY